MVPPVGPQPLLRASGESGASNNEAACHRPFALAGRVRAVSDLGLAVGGVVDVEPRGLGDCCDGASNACGAAADGHRVAHVEAVQRDDGVVGPEAGVDPDGQRAGGAGASDAGDGFVEEPDRAAPCVR